MPLSVLLPMVVFGIAGIAVLLHMLGLSRPRRLTTSDEALAAWLRENPDRDPVKVALASDQQAALIYTARGQGLVWVMGADTVARPFRHDNARITDDGLEIYWQDIGTPVARIHLSETDLADWRIRAAAT